ncbi:putative non-specific serine/threonine protein kinase [Helianthus annuus]|nr:putative non-specific serine/threonine protein kinase [Helianthus annuus]
MSNNSIMWSSNTTSSGNATAKLDDSGNLVVIDGHNKSILWQSFDYPTDTFLPGMKFGRDNLTGREWHLSSPKSSEDLAPGKYIVSVDTNGYPQIIIKDTNDSLRFRAGPWNGVGLSGALAFDQKSTFRYNMVISCWQRKFVLNINIICRT